MQPTGLMIVAGRGEGSRLDRFLAAELGAEYSRAQIARMIKAGRVTLNDRVAKASATLRDGDRIAIAPPPPPEPLPRPVQAPHIEVLYADDDLIVVNKPAGMTVHHAPGHDHSTLVDALLARFPELVAMAEPDGVMRPGIVHRLDKETSGVMVVARTPFARNALSQQFKERSVVKHYIAVVDGVIGRERITIARALGRHPTERKRMSIHSRSPRAAVSHVTLLARFVDASLVGVRPETGRTHQIRVHLASIGHPCLDDALYGRRRDAGIGRQALHAAALSVTHPRGGRLSFRASLPDDLQNYLQGRGVANADELIESWVAAGTARAGTIDISEPLG